MPVFPLVASRMILSRVSFPLRSPSRIMFKPARSFTDPPGLKNSAFPKISTPGKSRAIRSSRINGVFPMSCSRSLATNRESAATVVATGIGIERDSNSIRPLALDAGGGIWSLDFRQEGRYCPALVSTHEERLQLWRKILEDLDR